MLKETGRRVVGFVSAGLMAAVLWMLLGSGLRVKQRIDQGWSLLESGRSEDAVRLLEVVVQGDDPSPRGHFVLGQAYFRLLTETAQRQAQRQGQLRLSGFEECIVAAEGDSLKRNACHTVERIASGQQPALLGRPSSLADDSRLAAEGQQRRAEAQVLAQLHDRALGAFRRAAELDPANQNGIRDPARHWITQLTRLTRGSTPSRQRALELEAFSRAEQAFSTGRHEEAIAFYETALEREPRSAMLHLHLGDAYFARGDHRTALARYRQSLILDPRDPTAWDHVGDALRALGAYADAVNAYQWSLQVDPAYLTALAKVESTQTLVQSGPPPVPPPPELLFQALTGEVLAAWKESYGPFALALLSGHVPVPSTEVLLYDPRLGSQLARNDQRLGVRAQFDPKTGLIQYPSDMYFKADGLVEDLATFEHEMTHQMKKLGFSQRDLPLAAACGYLRWWELSHELRDQRPPEGVLSLLEVGRRIARGDTELGLAIDNTVTYFDDAEGEPPESYTTGAILAGVALELAHGDAERGRTYLIRLTKGGTHDEALAAMRDAGERRAKR